MAIYYLDSSALVKQYVTEIGSIWVRNLLSPSARNENYIAAITPVEITAAIMGRARNHDISNKDAIDACQQVQIDVSNDYQVIILTEAVLASAVTLAMQEPLRGYDAVQLATALEVNRLCIASGLPSLTFVSADAKLNAAASAQGLQVEDPNQHP